MLTPAAYEVGYRAACAKTPRQAPLELVQGEQEAWLIGYDDAEREDEQGRALVLAGFSK